MSQPNLSTAMGRSVIDELARGGVELIVISPGSRSTALALAAEEHPRIETRVVLDERSAGFHALGRAKVTGRPTGPDLYIRDCCRQLSPIRCRV